MKCFICGYNNPTYQAQDRNTTESRETTRASDTTGASDTTASQELEPVEDCISCRALVPFSKQLARFCIETKEEVKDGQKKVRFDDEKHVEFWGMTGNGDDKDTDCVDVQILHENMIVWLVFHKGQMKLSFARKLPCGQRGCLCAEKLSHGGVEKVSRYDMERLSCVVREDSTQIF